MYPVVSHTEVRTEIIQEFQDSMFTIRLLSGGVSGILILIGVINFINVMLTGIFTRRTELAVMESVGMTQKQVRRMLMLEGIYYAGITLALILTLGSGILYLVGFMTEKTADYAVYRYPWGWLAILSSLIFAICILVPILVYRVERAVYLIKRDTRHFAKRQLTWFRREKCVTCVDRQDFADENSILQFLITKAEELKQ